MSFCPRLLLASFLFLLSCDSQNSEGGAPIVLGDSSTIVTETDPKYLTNYVDDIQLRPANPDTAADQPETAQQGTDETVTSSGTSTEEEKKEPVVTKSGSGLNIPFKEVTVFIPGIETKIFQSQDLQKASGATYMLTGGKLNENRLELNGATISNVAQRHLTKVTLEANGTLLEVTPLNNLTDWQPVKGNGKLYTIKGLDRPEIQKLTASQIRLAVSRAAKAKRMSRKNIQEWERAVHNVRSLDQKPFTVVIKSVMWKIDGKDANGKFFQKQVRLDLPV